MQLLAHGGGGCQGSEENCIGMLLIKMIYMTMNALVSV